MSFKLNINILADTDNITTGREQYNPLLRTTRNHIRRPRLEGYIAAIRRVSIHGHACAYLRSPYLAPLLQPVPKGMSGQPTGLTAF